MCIRDRSICTPCAGANEQNQNASSSRLATLEAATRTIKTFAEPVVVQAVVVALYERRNHRQCALEDAAIVYSKRSRPAEAQKAKTCCSCRSAINSRRVVGRNEPIMNKLPLQRSGETVT